jgi:ABC-type enterochelin transport system permease subunit
MTPKEKAYNLIGKFMMFDTHDEDSFIIRQHRAKQYALLIVDEMIAFVKHAFSYINIELATPSIVYLEEVKQEIEKL